MAKKQIEYNYWLPATQNTPIENQFFRFVLIIKHNYLLIITYYYLYLSMAKNIVNITEENDIRLMKINAVMAINNKRFKNNSDLINEIIIKLDEVIQNSDEDTLEALTGLKKTF